MPPLFEMRGMGPRLKGVHIIRVSSVVLSYRTASLCVSPFFTVGLSIPSSDVLLLLLNSVTWLSDFVRPNTKDKTQLTFHSFIHWFHTNFTKRHRQNFFCGNRSLLSSFEMHHRKPRINSVATSGIVWEFIAVYYYQQSSKQTLMFNQCYQDTQACDFSASKRQTVSIFTPK